MGRGAGHCPLTCEKGTELVLVRRLKFNRTAFNILPVLHFTLMFHTLNHLPIIYSMRFKTKNNLVTSQQRKTYKSSKSY